MQKSIGDVNLLMTTNSSHAVLFTLAICTFFLALSMTFSSNAFARKTNQAIYEEPFDLASGGSTLTRATQEGILFANPAQLPYGGKFFRWFGLKTSLMTNKESISFAKDMANSAGSSGSSTSEGESSGSDGGQTQEFVDKVFETPIHFGASNALSWISNNGGISAFYRFEPDVAAKKFSETGLPAINFQAEAYGGIVGSVAARTPWSWLSLGLTGKYLYVAEPSLSVALNDEEKIKELQQSKLAQNMMSLNKGTGFDTGVLMFFQGYWCDYRLALKVDDVGTTKLSGDNEPKSFKQTIHAGTSLTFHNDIDAIHLSADVRDITRQYDEALFKRLYLGMKILFRGYVGLGGGLYQGYPSYGAYLDLIFMRLSATYYTRELGDHPGVEPRNLYVMSFSLGF